MYMLVLKNYVHVQVHSTWTPRHRSYSNTELFMCSVFPLPQWYVVMVMYTIQWYVLPYGLCTRCHDVLGAM